MTEEIKKPAEDARQQTSHKPRDTHADQGQSGDDYEKLIYNEEKQLDPNDIHTKNVKTNG